MNSTFNRTLWACLVLSAASAQTKPGEIQGVVRNEAGAPVNRAFVSIHVRPTARPPAAPYDSSMITAANGAYSFKNVPPGLYEVCAQSVDGDMLATCVWPTTPLRVTVGEAQVVSTAVTLRRGHRLRIRFNDPRGLLRARDAEAKGGNLLINVGPTALGSLGLLTPETATPALRQYSVLVPFETAVTLSVRSNLFRVSNSRAVALDTVAGHRETVNIPRTGNPAPIDFNIVDVQPGR